MQIWSSGNPEGLSLLYEFLRPVGTTEIHDFSKWADKNGFRVWWSKDLEKLNYSVRVVW